MKQFVIFIFFLPLVCICQHKPFASPHTKGKMFANWGWNRGAFTPSTLHIKGDDYDLTLQKIKAKDRFTPITYYNYLKIDRVTIPQTNARLGYFIKNNTAIVMGVDHMKYVITQDQTATVTGEITRNGIYQKKYNGSTKLTEDFLAFEHTDGLNYVNIGIEKYLPQYTNKKHTINITYLYGVTVGALVPKTNVKFLDYERTDRYHLSGYGLQLRNAIQANFFKHLIIRMEGNVGFINMPNIVLHKTGIQGKGKQHFGYAQLNWQIGYNFKF